MSNSNYPDGDDDGPPPADDRTPMRRSRSRSPPPRRSRRRSHSRSRSWSRDRSRSPPVRGGGRSRDRSPPPRGGSRGSRGRRSPSRSGSRSRSPARVSSTNRAVQICCFEIRKDEAPLNFFFFKMNDIVPSFYYSNQWILTFSLLFFLTSHNDAVTKQPYLHFWGLIPSLDIHDHYYY